MVLSLSLRSTYRGKRGELAVKGSPYFLLSPEEGKKEAGEKEKEGKEGNGHACLLLFL